MIVERSANAVWNGDLRHGDGQVELGSGAFKGGYSFSSRFEKGTGTNPEELIAAAHSSCFSMALANQLAQAGYNPEFVETTARVQLVKKEKGFLIPAILLETRAAVPDIDARNFIEQARIAKERCPVSKLLASAKVALEAKLVKSSKLLAKS